MQNCVRITECKVKLSGMYTIQEHVHNYATWTAARAVQRNFTNTATIRHAIEYSRLGEEVIGLDEKLTNELEFDAWHRERSAMLIEGLLEGSLPDEKVTYGRVAKILAIYLKTSVVLVKPRAPISNLIHPPVDRILLNNLYWKHRIELFNTARSKWTEFNESQYFSVVRALREIQQAERLTYFWELEKYWKV